MPIGNVIQRGKTIYVYNEKNNLLFAKNLTSNPDDEVTGYTNSTVNIQLNETIYTYEGAGQKSSVRQQGVASRCAQTES